MTQRKLMGTVAKRELAKMHLLVNRGNKKKLMDELISLGFMSSRFMGLARVELLDLMLSQDLSMAAFERENKLMRGDVKTFLKRDSVSLAKMETMDAVVGFSEAAWSEFWLAFESADREQRHRVDLAQIIRNHIAANHPLHRKWA